MDKMGFIYQPKMKLHRFEKDNKNNLGKCAVRTTHEPRTNSAHLLESKLCRKCTVRSAHESCTYRATSLEIFSPRGTNCA